MTDEVFDEDDYYFDDLPEKQVRRPFLRSKNIATFLAVISVASLGFTYAAKISINSNGQIEFGQGTTQTLACSQGTAVTVKPLRTFTNGSGATANYYVSGVQVSNVPSSCNNNDFLVRGFKDTNAPLALFNGTSTDAYVFASGVSYTKGQGTGYTVTKLATGSFEIDFTIPVAVTSDLYKVTLESMVHTPTTCATGGACAVGDTGPGGGVVVIIPSTSGNSTGKYFEMLGTDTGSSLPWCNVKTVTGITAASIGSGASNTTAMVGACSSGAGNTVHALTVNGFSDWFLPSDGELQAALKAGSYLGLTTGSTNLYWSSTEYDINTACADGIDATFTTLSYGSGTKTPGSSSIRTRAMRSFTV